MDPRGDAGMTAVKKYPVRVLLEWEQWATIHAQADAWGISVQEYIRWMLPAAPEDMGRASIRRPREMKRRSK